MKQQQPQVKPAWIYGEQQQAAAARRARSRHRRVQIFSTALTAVVLIGIVAALAVLFSKASGPTDSASPRQAATIARGIERQTGATGVSCTETPTSITQQDRFRCTGRLDGSPVRTSVRFSEYSGNWHAAPWSES